MEIIVGDRQCGKTDAIVQLAIQDGPLARICVYCQPEKRRILEQYGKSAQGWPHGTGQLNNDQVIVLQRPEQLHGRFQTEAGEAGPSFRPLLHRQSGEGVRQAFVCADSGSLLDTNLLPFFGIVIKI